MEIWKDIKENKKYEVSNLGRIRNKKTKRILKTTVNNKGYERFIIYGEKSKPKMYYVHRIVASSFIENTDNRPEVNHINEVKTDNRVENLEWVSSDYNLHYGTRLQRIWNTKKQRGIYK